MKSSSRFAIGLVLTICATLAHSGPPVFMPSFAYIPNSNTNTLSILDTNTNTVTDTLVLYDSPGHYFFPGKVAVNPDTTRVYVTHNDGSGLVSVLDTASKSIVATVSVGQNPTSMAVTLDGTRVYVAGSGGFISEIDATSNTLTALFATDPGLVNNQIAVDPTGTRLYAAFSFSSELRVIDIPSRSIVARVTLSQVGVGGGPSGVAVNLLGTRAYVASETGGQGFVSVVDTATNAVVATVPVGDSAHFSFPYGLAVSRDSSQVYVAVQACDLDHRNPKGYVAVINANTNTRNPDVPIPPATGYESMGASPIGVAVRADDGTVYVTDSLSNQVTAIETTCNTVKAIAVGNSPHTILGNFIAPVAVPPLQPPPPPPANIRVTGIEVTQGIQDLANSVTLIQGRRTFVRVYVQSDGAAVEGVTATLTASAYIACSALQCPPGSQGTLLGPLIPSNEHGPRITVRSDPKRTNLDDSFVFELPWLWTEYKSLRLHVELSASAAPPKTACTNDFVADPLHEFGLASEFKVHFVRMAYEFPGNLNGVTYSYHEASVEEQRRNESVIRRLLPLSTLVPGADHLMYDADLGMHVQRTAPECLILPADDQSKCAFLYVSAKLAELQASSGPLGLLPGPAGSGFIGKANAAYALIPQVPEVVKPGDSFQYFTRGACCVNRVAAGASDSFDTAAHEMAHFLGRPHPAAGAVLCGHSASDPDYPYFQSLIAPPLADPRTAMAGFDSGDPNLARPAPMRALIASSLDATPVDTFDVMGYCKPRWISDYTYKKLYICALSVNSDLQGATAGCPSSYGYDSAAQPGDWLSVFGNINRGAARADFSSRHLDRVFNVPPRTLGSYMIQLLDEAGVTLATYPFTPDAIDDTESPGGGSLQSFGHVVPFAVGTRAIQIVDASRGNLVIGTKAVSPHPPIIGNVATQTPGPTGVATLGWTASDVDGDSLRFDVYYTHDSGTSLLPLMLNVAGSSVQVDTSSLAGGLGQFRVVASDGVNTAWAQSAPFSLANKPPSPRILNPGDGVKIYTGQLVNLQGEATDPQDGLIPDSGLAWTISGKPIGIGPRLSLTDLPLGLSQIILTATNSMGLSARSSVNVNVQPTLLKPNPTLTAGPRQVGWNVAVGESRVQTAKLEVGNSGGGSLEFSLQSSAPWLTLSTTSASAPATIILNADPSRFASGTTATATVTLTAISTPNQVIDVPVTLAVGDTFNSGESTTTPPVDTGPTITNSIVGTLGANDWYTSDVTVSWSVTDSAAPITNQIGCLTTLINTDTAGQTLTCSATSAGGSTTQSVTIKRDTLPPGATGTLSPLPNANGWNNGNVVAHFTATDATSGPGTCTADQTLTAEGAAQSASGSCTDLAGISSATVTLSGINIDKTPPSVSASRAPLAPVSGWTNVPVVVSFTGADAQSTVAANGCSAPITILRDGPNQSATGSCTDLAGNTASASLSSINIDRTAPTAYATATPAANGAAWNNSNVTVTFMGTDAMTGSGIAFCTPNQEVAVEGAGLTASGTCTDVASNQSTPTTATLSIDKTPPTATINSPANGASIGSGSAVAASYRCNDSLSGVPAAQCVGTVANGALIDTSSSGPKTFTVTPTDLAGNQGAAVSVTYTVTAGLPIIRPIVTGTLGTNGWYRGNVALSWSVTSSQSAITATSGCGAVTLSKNTTGTIFTCRATSAGGTASASITIKRDATAPSIEVESPDDDPYVRNSTLKADYRCRDAVSGISRCVGTVPLHALLDTSRAGNKVFTVTATDYAGNTKTTTVRYAVR